MNNITIRISSQNWQWLNGLKRPGESFNDVLDRLRTGEIENAIDDTNNPGTLPDNLDLPGSGETLERRQATLSRLYNYLQDHGTATKQDLLQLVDPDEVGYASTESFWSNAIKGRDSLRSLPGIEPPAEGERTWRYIDESK